MKSRPASPTRSAASRRQSLSTTSGPSSRGFSKRDVPPSPRKPCIRTRSIRRGTTATAQRRECA
eukprot:8875280-Heterocapsa_arctica.AAC.1